MTGRALALLIPKEWLDKAVAWAAGANTKETALSKLTSGIYSSSSWLYRDGATTWQALVEGTANQGNCVSFSNVWSALAQVLGVSGTSVRQTKGANSKGFVTKPATALDGLRGNAHPAGGATDRWVFGMHQVGKTSGLWGLSTITLIPHSGAPGADF